ncbi:hypothetical protein BRC82_10130 [Halobacteriales archaeon QS_1_67_19]|nr:MAG: hypothetical protein BRC82_10130 [Halobacteriales archaeon QS_1_67_19]
MVYATRGLVDALLELAEQAEPDRLTVSLAVTSAAEFEDGIDLADETPVFTHFYPPSTGGSLSAVFGMNLSIPAGQTHGRFVTHPRGDLEVAKTDDLHEVVLVAVPPWDDASLGAFDRSGRRQRLRIVDAEPPTESLA